METIEKSYGYKDLGKDFRAGIRYVITMYHADHRAFEIALAWQIRIIFGKWLLEPAPALLSVDPFVATFGAGGVMTISLIARQVFDLRVCWVGVGDVEGEFSTSLSWSIATGSLT